MKLLRNLFKGVPTTKEGTGRVDPNDIISLPLHWAADHVVMYPAFALLGLREGRRCVVGLDDAMRPPTRQEVAGVMEYADVLRDKLAYLEKWLKGA